MSEDTGFRCPLACGFTGGLGACIEHLGTAHPDEYREGVWHSIELYSGDPPPAPDPDSENQHE